MMVEQNWPVKKIQTILSHSSAMIAFDVNGHLFSLTEGDVDLFERMQADLLAS